MNAWKNKTILISGGGSGIGLALVEYALSQGAKVSTILRKPCATLNDIDSKRLLVFQGDIGERLGVQQWIALTREQFQHIDVVISNAGCMYYMSMDKPNYQQMHSMVTTNCLGMINLIDAVMAQMDTHRACHWINISSDAGKTPFPGLAIYSGTKAFIEFTTKAMRQELMDYPFKMTNIQPGNVRTALHGKSTEESAMQQYATQDSGQYLSTKDIVAAIDYSLSTPFEIAVNEILLQPRVESI